MPFKLQIKLDNHLKAIITEVHENLHYEIELLFILFSFGQSLISVNWKTKNVE